MGSPRYSREPPPSTTAADVGGFAALSSHPAPPSLAETPSCEDPTAAVVSTIFSNHLSPGLNSAQSFGIAPHERKRSADIHDLQLPMSPIRRKPSPSVGTFHISMPFVSPGQLALEALTLLPVPVLVLDHLKTVVLANEAMGRLLSMDSAVDEHGYAPTVGEQLRGQTLAQVGIDVLQDGRPVWVTWETLLDSAAQDFRTKRQAAESGSLASQQNTAVDVVVVGKDVVKSGIDPRPSLKEAKLQQIHAKMIISVWELDESQVYFTLTFTHSDSPSSSVDAKRGSLSRQRGSESSERKPVLSNSNPSPSVPSSRGSNSPMIRGSPGAASISSTVFPPMGPPSAVSMHNSPSVLQKMTLMKDGLLDSVPVPVFAMWKDKSVAVPNKAAREMMLPSKQPGDDELLTSWVTYSEDFSRMLEVDEYPISILLKTEQPFDDKRIGMYKDERKVVYSCIGRPLTDPETGEFLAGLLTCNDITGFTQQITQIKRRDDERFRLICDTMPQLVWCCQPNGYTDFFNSRWYDYTGLTPEESMGWGWRDSFHPDDIPDTVKRWTRSLETGKDFMTEYRCRDKHGKYRWMIARAMPLVNPETGKIERWFGTTTDIDDAMEAKLAARQMRERLLNVIAHAQVTIFTVDLDRKVTMLEGALIWDADGACKKDASDWYIGQPIEQVFKRLYPQQEADSAHFLRPIDDILTRRRRDEVTEHSLSGQWYRTRFLPIVQNLKSNKADPGANIEGVIGVIQDVTLLKNREEEIEEQARERQQLLANEAAAKEASRLKSQFLANMSHEIRTPITGVIGMSELLLDLELGQEQRDFALNIQRSAIALLTVINDILDFSKVESGHLDIEEIRFSLPIAMQEVTKMLSFSAEQKSLDFQVHIAPEIDQDLTVMGDPGRVRQILVNLLTNSIKFTNNGYVKLYVTKERENTDVVEIKFMVEDSGIGIEEDVRKRLFQPFSQGDPSTARRFGGTGLGLTICKHLLGLMHGRISLESQLGCGTTASFWIPFNKPQGPRIGVVDIDTLPQRLQSEISASCNSGSDPEPNATPTPTIESIQDKGRSPLRLVTVGESEDLPTSERAKIHILVVEDNQINQQIAIKTIQKFGFTVDAVWNGKEALEYLMEAQKGQKRKPDIILMDIQMPLIDGYRCTHLLRYHLPYRTYVQNVPIVAMTASAIQGDQEKCTRAGMDDYLSKPVQSKILETMLVRWSLQRGRSRQATASSFKGAENPSGGSLRSTGLRRSFSTDKTTASAFLAAEHDEGFATTPEVSQPVSHAGVGDMADESAKPPFAALSTDAEMLDARPLLKRGSVSSSPWVSSPSMLPPLSGSPGGPSEGSGRGGDAALRSVDPLPSSNAGDTPCDESPEVCPGDCGTVSCGPWCMRQSGSLAGLFEEEAPHMDLALYQPADGILKKHHPPTASGDGLASLLMEDRFRDAASEHYGESHSKPSRTFDDGSDQEMS